MQRTVYHSYSEKNQYCKLKIEKGNQVFDSSSCLTNVEGQRFVLFRGWLTNHSSGQRADTV